MIDARMGFILIALTMAGCSSTRSVQFEDIEVEMRPPNLSAHSARFEAGLAAQMGGETTPRMDHLALTSLVAPIEPLWEPRRTTCGNRFRPPYSGNRWVVESTIVTWKPIDAIVAQYREWPTEQVFYQFRFYGE